MVPAVIFDNSLDCEGVSLDVPVRTAVDDDDDDDDEVLGESSVEVDWVVVLLLVELLDAVADGVGAFLEKKEKRFFCFGGGLFVLAIV